MGRAVGISEDQIAEIGEFATSNHFDEREKLALEFALAVSATPVKVPDDLFAKLRALFDEAQLVELAAVAAWENYMARFNRVFEVEAAGFSEGAVCPLPDHQVSSQT